VRRLKVDVDLDSGSVVIKTTVQDFLVVSTAAALRCYEGISETSNRERMVYHQGVLHFVKGIETLISMQTRPDAYEDPIPLLNKTTKQRWAAVEHEKLERQLLDKIINEALATRRTEKEA
jgi:hypothetical protein